MKSLIIAVILLTTSFAQASFKLRDYREETWDNGLQVTVIEDHSLPAVSFGLLIKDGAAGDVMGKSGLTNLMARLLQRGTTTRSATEVADELGQIGSGFDSDVSDDFIWLEVGGLSNRFKKLLDVFSDVALHPSFDAEELNRERKQILAEIQKRYNNPDHFADESFKAFLFGGSPYGRRVAGLEMDLKGLDRKDLLKLYMKKVRPNNAILIVTGDVPADFTNQLKTAFGGWQKSELDQKLFTQPPEIKGIQVRVVDKHDLTQSQIVMGNVGIKRSNPDYLQIRLANTILGGNFTSRLMDQVRDNLGLTYGISSSFDARYEKGPFEISTFTRNKAVGTTIRETLNVFSKFVNEGVTDKEVADSKSYMKGTFPRAIETPDRLGFNLAILRLYGVDDGYLKNFINNVEKITTAEVNEVIKKYFHKDDLKILVLTNSTETLEQIRPLGLVEVKAYDSL